MVFETTDINSWSNNGKIVNYNEDICIYCVYIFKIKNKYFSLHRWASDEDALSCTWDSEAAKAGKTLTYKYGLAVSDDGLNFTIKNKNLLDNSTYYFPMYGGHIVKNKKLYVDFLSHMGDIKNIEISVDNIF